MKIPVIRGLIDRRILVNYRVDPEVLAGHLPAPFRPKLYRGFGLAGICLIRLRSVRPRWLPRWLGTSSENAAHRFAVEWDENGELRQGVYIPRRDTGSWPNALAGGRIFPGIHHHARFQVREGADHFEVAVRSDDGQVAMFVAGDAATELPVDSLFTSVADASDFFEEGGLGYSATPDGRTHQGLELRCRRWEVQPLSITSARSSFFDDREAFPPEAIALDCGLLMRGIEHEWHSRADLCCASGTGDGERSLLGDVTGHGMVQRGEVQ